MRSQQQRQHQSGFGTIGIILAFIGLGLVFLVVFFISISGGDKPDTGQQQNNEEQSQETVSKEAPFIRIPENSKIYNSKDYGFIFAYPDGFGELTEKKTTSGINLQAESALAVQKPVGNGTAFMNGKLSVTIAPKDDFKIAVDSSDTSVGPAKTGNDTTWKIVTLGSGTQSRAIGDSYTVSPVKSQTGIAVFDFTYKPAGSLALGRWVFAAGDYYVMIALPTVSKPSGESLTESDVAAYVIIGNNIAKTVRVPAPATDSTN